MHRSFVTSGLTALFLLAGCGDDNILCGPGTTQTGRTCVATAGTSTQPDGGAPTKTDGGGLSCGRGTISSGGQCIVAPPASITQARLTYLDVKYDLTKPVFLNNPLPIRFGITSKSTDMTRPATSKVTVLFSFVEASPKDPANPKTCDSNGIVLSLVGNGAEQQFDADIFPTTDCDFAGDGVVANLAVDFDRALRMGGKPTGIDYPPVTLSDANSKAADNRLCVKKGSGAMAEKGCVYAVPLRPTPMGTDGKALVDVKLDTLVPDSSVAVVWPTAEDPDVPKGSKESNPPSIVVNATFVMNGRDPYKIQIDPKEIPADLIAADPTIAADLKFGLTDDQLAALDDLPGTASVKYDIAPSNKISASAWLPLMIDDPKNPDPDGHVTEIDLSALQPGTDNGVTHALYVEGDALTAVTGTGPWASDDDFTVRGCLIASFPEGGNAGDEDPADDPAGGDVAKGDCHTFKVRLVRAPAPTTSASAHGFDMTWSRTAGDPGRIALIGSLRTNNGLDLSGAKSDSEGKVDVKGNIGGEFGVTLFRAYAKAGALTALASSYVDLGVDAFGVNVFGYQNTSSDFTYSQPLMVAKDFQFPGLAFGFGPVSIGITAGVGGNVGLTPTFTISAKDGPEASVPALAMATSNGFLQATVTPSVGLTGNVTGGIDVWVASAKAVATLQVVDIGFPLTAALRWGVTAKDGDAVKQLTIKGDLTWDLTINWLNVNCDLIGKVGFFSKTINVFKYENTPETINLLKRTLGDPVVLE